MPDSTALQKTASDSAALQKTASDSTALQKVTQEPVISGMVGDQEYALFTVTSTRLIELIRTNIGRGLKFKDLDQIKVPIGGSTKFEIPSVKGGTESVLAFDCLVLHQMPIRRYWKKDYGDGAKKPQDCLSNDLITGIGSPGGICKRCPYQEWGSKPQKPGVESRAQACQERRLLFVVPPTEILPQTILVSPTSLEGISKHMYRLTSRGKAFYEVSHRFTLTPAKNDRFEFATLVGVELARLSPEQIAYIKTLVDVLRPELEQIVITQEDTMARDNSEKEAF